MSSSTGRWAVVAVPCASDHLVRALADGLQAPILGYDRVEFPNHNLLVTVDPASVPPDVDSVLLVADGCGAHDGHLTEIGLVADAIRRIQPVTVHGLLRYLPYSRSNRARPGESLGAKVYVDLLCALPVDTWVMFNLHASELVGFFSTSVYSLDVLPLVADELTAAGRTYDLVVGTDRGRQDECTLLADTFGSDVNFFTKRRIGHDGTIETLESSISGADGHRVLLFDDEIVSGQSAHNAALRLADAGASSIDFFTVYDFAAPGAFERLAAVPAVTGIYRTNAAMGSDLTSLPVPTRTFDVTPLVHRLYSYGSEPRSRPTPAPVHVP